MATPLYKMNKQQLLAKCKDLEEKLEFTNKVKEDYFNTIKWKNDMIVDLEEEINNYKDLIGDFPLKDLEECINTYLTADNYVDECKSLQYQLDVEREENKKIGGLVISQTDKLKEVSLKHNNLFIENEELKEDNKKLIAKCEGLIAKCQKYMSAYVMLKDFKFKLDEFPLDD